ncbi:MAG: tRNA (adenosine(37)-N6)-threonylcarbamoyltransferase complex dimerization subunit type 1 TsaB [Polyangiaceae bacterium]|nr:tRNA (adenosine(37)-N6)-threonylcarbamoyltransferase complex dimerization subunit type 1 TsaB [Polyangiaceae bacterium]
MRVLGIETSSRRASVALTEGDQLVVRAETVGFGTHGEHTLPLVDRLVAEAGFAQSSIDRVAVGVGPGSFTGLRVGIALARGIALGLDIPVFGVRSLEAMAHAVPSDRPGVRCVLLDARRSEAFFAAYGPALVEVLSARTLPCSGAVAAVQALCPGPQVFVGEFSAALVGPDRVFRSPRSDLPDATDTALIAAARPLALSGATPLYVREADAVFPDLQRSRVVSPEPSPLGRH